MSTIYQTYTKFLLAAKFLLCRMSSLSNLVMLHVFADMFMGMTYTLITSLYMFNALITLLIYRLSYVKEDIQYYKRNNISPTDMVIVSIMKIKNMSSNKEFNYDDYAVRLMHIILLFMDYSICITTYLGVCYASYYIQNNYLNNE